MSAAVNNSGPGNYQPYLEGVSNPPDPQSSIPETETSALRGDLDPARVSRQLSCNLSLKAITISGTVLTLIIIVGALAISGNWIPALVVGGIFLVSGLGVYRQERLNPGFIDDYFQQIEEHHRRIQDSYRSRS